MTRRHVRRVHGLPDALPAAAAGADGAVREPRDRARVAARACREILDAPVEVRGAADADARCRRCAARSCSSTSRCRSTAARPVLERLSFCVAPARSLAIVGPSGSGKSTIADLLLRLLDPDSGAVRLDGHDLRALRLDDLRRHVALVDQEPCILHASIAENIRYARPDATRRGGRARPRGRRRSTTFIDALPEGYDTIVGERGSALSAGERQRLATRAGVPGRPGGARARRADRGARSGRRAAGGRRLRGGDARPHDDRHHPSPRPGAAAPIASSCSTARASSSRAAASCKREAGGSPAVRRRASDGVGRRE